MINYVQVKRIIGSILIIGMFASCSMWNAWFGQEEIKVGEYTTLEVEENSLLKLRQECREKNTEK